MRSRPTPPDATPGTPTELLVCVYYRVRRPHRNDAIARVREFQRALLPRWTALEADLHVRWEVSSPAPSRAGPAVPVDDTLMETYRLPLAAPAVRSDADEVVNEFLRALDAAAAPLAGLLLGPRHLELFAPCAS